MIRKFEFLVSHIISPVLVVPASCFSSLQSFPIFLNPSPPLPVKPPSLASCPPRISDEVQELLSTTSCGAVKGLISMQDYNNCSHICTQTNKQTNNADANLCPGAVCCKGIIIIKLRNKATGLCQQFCRIHSYILH